MTFYSERLKWWLDRWPGKKTFGVYRFLPAFFLLGAALEFSMINWTVGQTNFYNTYKKRQAKIIAEERLRSVEAGN
ncbi:Small integral membrane protein 4 [Sergentomyia squamirostris]